MKKILLLDLIVLLLAIAIAYFTTIFFPFSLTDCFFVLGVAVLFLAVVFLFVARQQIIKTIQSQKKDEEKAYRNKFNLSEIRAFSLFFVSLILFLFSYLVVRI